VAHDPPSEVCPCGRLESRRVRNRGGGPCRAATVLELYGRAFHRTIRAEHATISRFGPRQRAAVNALMKEPAGGRGHLFQCRLTAFRACQD
jgi:hypothetical protein